MKRMLLTLIASLALIAAKAQLREGVYEYAVLHDTDTVQVISPLTSSSSRRLIVKHDEERIKALYLVDDYSDFSGGASIWGNTGCYYLKLKAKASGTYKAKNKHIKISLTPTDNATVEVEVHKGTLTTYYSGGAYFRRDIPFLPEKVLLTFVRELTPEDEEELLKGKFK